MKLGIALPLFLLLAFSSHTASAETLDLTGYQDKGGAITSYYMGDTIDPYFATKALLLAKDADLDAHKQSLAWIKWALHAQRGDGLFNRYKQDADKNWIVYYRADADDAILALWIELLYRNASGAMPASWTDSIRRSELRLDELLDKDSGIYHISAEMPVGLLMDNTEIYASFSNAAKECKRLGLIAKGKIYQQKADALRDGIEKTFGREGHYAITTQERNENEFYPDRVAQLFPLMYRLKNDDERKAYQTWLKANGKDWLTQRVHDYPWGLVAIMAIDMNDADSAACWQNRAEPMRYSGHWNILEEVALQHVKYRLKLQKYDKIPCVGGDLV